MVDIKTWSKLSTEIEQSSNILILNPKDADGDSLGSSLALYGYLLSLDKPAMVFAANPPQRQYDFLPYFDTISSDTKALKLSDFDLVICVDFADLKMLGLPQDYIDLINEKTLVNIDHHPTNHQFGTINIVEPLAAATTEILYYFFEDQNIPYGKNVATCLLAGIIYDTGSFAHLNTTQSVIDISSRLLIRGARLKIITRQSLNKPIETLKLWGTALSRLTHHPHLGLSSTVITQNDLLTNGASLEATSGIANFLNNLAGAKAILVLTEESGNVIKGSLRTTTHGVGVSRLAELLGGGGHKKAAGFTIKGSFEYENNHWQIV